ncbi:MAG: hypothetical protein L6V79_06340 [Clostridium sp.]|nr:MAG: hypothetical protein L6V79_06340 [Clostridium sp.]
MKVSDVIKNCFVKLGYGVVDVSDAEKPYRGTKKDLSIFCCARSKTYIPR